jgi:tetratricopeptide (TPR) repeat protein
LKASIGELDDTDYVLRQNIAHDMIFKANSASCIICRQQYALQIAACYIIGFGVAENEQSSQDWLVKSGKGQADLNNEIELLGGEYTMTGSVSKRVLDALGIGVLVSNDRTEEYQISGRLPEAQQALQIEIAARQKVFGTRHCSLAKLMADMTMILVIRDQFTEAEKIQRDVVDILTKSFGDRHPSALAANVILASILAEEGWIQKSEEIMRHVRPILVAVLGAEHPETITASQVWAGILARQGKYQEAEFALRDLISARAKVLTNMHPITIKAEISLVEVLRGQGLILQALDMMNKIDDKMESIIIHDHHTRAHLYISQARLYTDLQIFDKAVEKGVAAMRAVERLYTPEDDSLRLKALETMAEIYGASQKLKEQENVLREMVQLKSSLGVHNSTLLTTKTMLAKNLLNQNMLDEASALAKEVLTILASSTAVDANSLGCTQVLATALSYEGKQEQAEEMHVQNLAHFEDTLGPTHPITLNAIFLLGEFYSEQGASGKTKQLYVPVLESFRHSQQFGKATIKLASLLAATERQLGNYDDAESLCEEIITWCKEACGEDHLETLNAYNILGKIYLERHKLSEAEDLYVTKLEKQSQGTELEIYVKNNMVTPKKQQGKVKEVEERTAEAFTLAETKYGESHPITINMLGNLLDISLDGDLTAEVEEMALDLIETKRKMFGTTHPSTINTVSSLAYAYSCHGRLENAQRLYESIEEAGGFEALQHSNPSRYAILCGKLGHLYFQQNEFQKAQEFEERSLSTRRHVYGSNHPATLKSMGNLASTLHAQKKYEDAGAYLRQIVTTYEEATTGSDPTRPALLSLLNSKASLAANLFCQEMFQEAAEIYRDVLEGCQKFRVDATIANVWKANFEMVLTKLPKQELLQI